MQFLQVDVVTPEKLIFSQEARELVLPGAQGSFGVLPGHMPLVADLEPGMLKIKDQAGEIVYAIGGGYAEITPHKVIVLADSAVKAEDIDIEGARQARAQAIAQMKKGLQGPDLEAVEITLRKALAQLQVVDIQRRRNGVKRS